MTSLAVLIGRGLLSARPAAGTPGSLYYATDTTTLYRDNGTSWDSVEGSAGLSNPMTTAGDLIIGGASGTPTRLGAGTNGQVLTVASGAPAWGAGGGGGYTQGARAYNSAALAVASATTVALTFDSERYDTDTIHDTVTNPSRLTCKTAGTYLILGQVWWAATGAGWRQVRIKLNGVTDLNNQIVYPVQAAGIETTQEIGTISALAVNDYVELVVQQSSGATLNVEASADSSPEFMMQRIG